MNEGSNFDLQTSKLEGLLDLDILKKIQSKYCRMMGVYAFTMDDDGKMLTDMTGPGDDTAVVFDRIGMDAFLHAYEIVKGCSLEEQVIEDTQYQNVKVAAIAINIGNTNVINWLLCAVLVPKAETEQDNIMTDVSKMVKEEDFLTVIDLLRQLTGSIVSTRSYYKTAKIEAQNSKSSQEDMSRSLARAEAITNMVSMLESDNSIEEVAISILKTTTEYLGISSSQLIRVNPGGITIDIISEFCNQGIASIFDQIRNIPRPLILFYTKMYIGYLDGKITKEERDYMLQSHIKAVAVLPILINGKTTMYACFSECRQDRTFTVDEIRFMNDATKIIQSILQKRIQKNSLISSYASLESILDHMGAAIYVEDEKNGKILFANKQLKSEFEQELKENRLNELFVEGKPLISGTNHYEVHYIEKQKWYEVNCTNLKWVDGRISNLYAAYNITEKKIYQKKIEQQAFTDFLTGLYNRMCCERDLACYIDEAKKHNQRGALLYLDLDDFKHINDGLGHQYGDVLLKAISHSLQRIEGITNTCYRMGGDEFVIIIPAQYYPRVKLIIEAIKGIFAKPWFLKDADYYCTMSMGVVEFPTAGYNVQELIKKADIAMYEAKKSGKNRIAEYNNNIDSSSNKRLDMEKNMRDATVHGYDEFEVYYQPIIDISLDGSPCTGAEALIRWNSKELGFIPPADFIPLAEYLGLINPIGNYVLMEACKTCKRWNDNGRPNFKVNVNLSVVQLLQADIAEIVERALQETGITPRNLTLEVTESLAINDMQRMKEILSKIKSLGVRIALDDFGTGYSSLNHIREIPLDVIKVDQSFVADLAEDTYSQSFIKMVGELANAIGVSLCVEGIETKEQYKVLEGMRVRMIQGYYFDKPMTQDKFEAKYVY